MKRSIKYLILLLAIWRNTISQNTIASQYFVKTKEIFIRWAPSNKQIFDIAIKNGYKITRYEGQGSSLTNSLVLESSLKPYSQTDTINWMPLLRKNDNAILAVQALYQNTPKANIPPKQKQDQQLMLYNLVLLSCDFDSEIAKACGLFLIDKNIDNTKTYTYKIEVNQIPPSLKITPAIISINASVLSENPKISNFSGQFKNKLVKLKWKVTNYKSFYSGYTIERSSDSTTFTKINKAPVILLTSQFEKNKETIYYNDTFPKVQTKYFYRIRGINHFGELSEPSNVISGIGFNELRSMPIIDSIKVIQNRNVFLRWRMQDRVETELPKEYILLRAKQDKGPYLPIYKSKLLSFTDENPMSSNYYKVGAVSIGNDTLYSYSYPALIIDTIPPSLPQNLKASVDSKGNVSLTWDKNPEDDVQGYKIYKANALSEEFVQINNEFAKQPFYKDILNLKTLSKKIYYSVVATDNNYNNSQLSKPIEVNRPDTIAPAAPIITEMKVLDIGIKLSWINSNSKDVKQYVLYKQKENTKSDIKVREWLAKDSLCTFFDSIVEPGLGYRYKLLASDEDDNIAISNVPYIRFETGFRKKITDVTFDVDRTLKRIHLKWNYAEIGVEKYVTYRAKK